MSAHPASSVEAARTPAEGEANVERLITCGACCPVVAPSLVPLVESVVPHTSAATIPLGAAVVYGVLALPLVVSLPHLLQRVSPRSAALASLLCLTFASTMVIDQTHTAFYLGVALNCFVLAVPWLFVASAVQDHARLLRYLYGAAVVIVVAAAVRLLLQGPALGSAASYSQSEGYQVLPAGVVLLDAVVRRPRLRTTLLLAAAVLLLLASGARGPVLALLLFGVARGAVALRRRAGAVFVLIVAGVAFARAVDALVRSGLTTLTHLFAGQDLSTRSLERIVQGSFLEDRARGSVARFAWDLVLQHPLTGVGAARDRMLLGEAMGVSDLQTARGWYPHNIVLELLLQYGFFVGGALVVALGVIVWRAVLDESDRARAQVVLVFVGIGLLPLLVSGSYLTSPLFFALLGLVLAARGSRRRTAPRPGTAASPG